MDTKQGWKQGKGKRVRTIFTPEQLERLEAEFEKQQYMVGTERCVDSTKLTRKLIKSNFYFDDESICLNLGVFFLTLNKRYHFLMHSSIFFQVLFSMLLESDGSPSQSMVPKQKNKMEETDIGTTTGKTSAI